MEATGVYHERLAIDLYDAGFCVSLANPHRSREFARGMGIMTKTDKVNAYMLACYALLKKPHSWKPPAPEIRHLSALLRRRDVLLGDAVREGNRLEKYLSTDTPADVISSCMGMAQLLREEVDSIERQIKAHIQACPDLKRDYSLLTSIKSVGPQLGMHMLAVLRSHNFESAEQVAAFLGGCGYARTAKISRRPLLSNRLISLTFFLRSPSARISLPFITNFSFDRW